MTFKTDKDSPPGSREVTTTFFQSVSSRPHILWRVSMSFALSNKSKRSLLSGFVNVADVWLAKTPERLKEVTSKQVPIQVKDTRKIVA